MADPGWRGVGTEYVGLPSEDIPAPSLMYLQAQARPGDLVRLYSGNIPNNTFVEEDGTYTGNAPSQWVLFVNGVEVGAFGEEILAKRPPISGTSEGNSQFPQRTIILGDQVFKVTSQNQLNQLMNEFMSAQNRPPTEEQPRQKVLVVQQVDVDAPSFLDWLSDQKH